MPTLLFIHGSGGTSVTWHRQAALSDVAEVRAIDLPGHGDAPGPVLPSVQAYADAVAATLDRPVVAAGLSLGGAIVQQLLLDHPDKVEAGVLIGTGAKLRVLPSIFHAIATNYAQFVQLSPEPLRSAMLANGPEVCAADFRCCDAFDVMDRVPEIRQPVLLISGRSDPLTPPRYLQWLHATLPDSQLVSVDAGHLSPLEAPEAVNDAIRTFI